MNGNTTVKDFLVGALSEMSEAGTSAIDFTVNAEEVGEIEIRLSVLKVGGVPINEVEED